MATLVRCIEGHAFDKAGSETCPICGSAIFEKESVVKNEPSGDLTQAKKRAEFAWGIVSLVVIGVATVLMVQYIRNSKFFIAISDTAQLVIDPPCSASDRWIVERLIEAPFEYRNGEKPCGRPSRGINSPKPNAIQKAIDPLNKTTVSPPQTPNQFEQFRNPKLFEQSKPENSLDPKFRFAPATGSENNNTASQPTTGKDSPNPFPPK